MGGVPSQFVPIQLMSSGDGGGARGGEGREFMRVELSYAIYAHQACACLCMCACSADCMPCIVGIAAAEISGGRRQRRMEQKRVGVGGKWWGGI